MCSVVWQTIKLVLYLDNEPLIETSNFRGGPTDTLKKTIESGVHRIKIDLLNHPIKEKNQN